MPRSRTISDLLTEISARFPKNEALVYGRERLTYEDLRERSRALAKGLQCLGIGKGDKVALLMGNQTEWLLTDFAVTSLGAIRSGARAWATYNRSRRRLMLTSQTCHRRKSLLAYSTLLAILGVVAAMPALAQKFPWRPIRLIVPYPPGGANDTVVRFLSPTLTDILGQQVVIDNRGGGNTIIGSELVARAAPDGHTVLMIAAGHAINPSLYPKLPYDTARDFAPVVLIGDGSYVLVAHPSLGATLVPELIALAKAKPGQITFASSSIGNLTHLAAELFSSMAGVKMLHVPYKGGGPAMLDLLGAGYLFSFLRSRSRGRTCRAARSKASA